MSDDLRIMFEIDGDTATVKFTDSARVSLESGSAHIIESFRNILCFITDSCEWVLTGVYRDGGVFTFERVNSCKDYTPPKTAKKKRRG